jgi:hypothetical protein
MKSSHLSAAASFRRVNTSGLPLLFYTGQLRELDLGKSCPGSGLLDGFGECHDLSFLSHIEMSFSIAYSRAANAPPRNA